MIIPKDLIKNKFEVRDDNLCTDSRHNSIMYYILEETDCTEGDGNTCRNFCPLYKWCGTDNHCNGMLNYLAHHYPEERGYVYKILIKELV